MDLGIKGKRAICAGASAGMGKEAARKLSCEGVDLVMSARREARLLAAAEEIAHESGETVTPVVADHGTEEGRARLLSACPEPDILVITCAPPRITPTFREVEADEWRESLETTLIGPIEMIKEVTLGMEQRGHGRIVMIGTGAAKNPAEIRLLSGPARSALCNYVMAISKGLIKSDVTINNILPGMFHTATIAERFGALAKENGTTYEEECAKFAREWSIPSEDFGNPEDVGAFVALLCSRFAGYISGQSIVIDGGISRSIF